MVVTCTLLDEQRKISVILGKANFQGNENNTYYKTVNIYKFSKEFSCKYYVPFLNAYRQAYGENEYYEQVLKVISFLDSTNLKAFPVSGDRWYEIDDVQDLRISENRFSKDADKMKQLQIRYGGDWRFPTMLHYCYLVNPSFTTISLVEEPNANAHTP